MKLILMLLCLVVFSSLVSAVAVTVNCPEGVEVNTEFTCNLISSEVDTVYDIKMQIEKEGGSVARIWNAAENKWQSSYYYLKGFLTENGEKEVKLKIEEEGNYAGVLKLRKEGSIELFNFDISTSGAEVIEEVVDEIVPEPEEVEVIEEVEEVVQEVAQEEPEIRKLVMPNEQGIISLNSEPEEVEGDLIYTSKNQKIMEAAPYAFVFVLIGIIGFLIWEKF